MEHSKIVTSDLNSLRENAYVRLRNGLREVEGAQAILVSVELAHGLTRLQDAVQAASGKVASAEAALTEPEQKVASARSAVTQCQTRIDECTESILSDSLDERVESRVLKAEYLIEMKDLQGILNSAAADLQAAKHQRDVFQQDLNLAEQMVQVRKTAMTQPFSHPISQSTESYQTFRAGLGSLIPILLRNDDTDDEWAPAMLLLKEINRLSGTIPTPVEPEKKELTFEKAPSGREVMDADIAALQVEMENKHLNEQTQVIEDYRHTPYIPPSARVAERSAMQLPGRKKKGKR